MPLQNRVLPTGEIVADPARGTFMGNRGILHDDARRLGRSRWKHQAWISCVLDFKGRHRAVMTPGRYTELFFLDEAVAMTAGHRPCGECRRARYRDFMRLWAEVCADLAAARPKDVDRVLHAARIDPATRKQRRFMAMLDTLPDGGFVLMNGEPLLVNGAALLRYRVDGYGPSITRPETATVEVLTPQPMLRLLHAGYRPEIHPSARTAPSASP